MFYHKERGIRVVIHGDDFTVLGQEVGLDWLRERIREQFEVKFRARLGPEDKDDKSVRLLNRVTEWTVEGIRYEADQRHGELIVKDMVFRALSVAPPRTLGRARVLGWAPLPMVAPPVAVRPPCPGPLDRFVRRRLE